MQASARLEDILEQHLIDEDVKQHLQARVKQLEIDLAAHENERSIQVSLLRQEEVRLRESITAATAAVRVTPLSLWELGAHSIPSCIHGTAPEGQLDVADEVTRLEHTESDIMRASFNSTPEARVSFTSTASADLDSSSYSAYLVATHRDEKEEASTTGVSPATDHAGLTADITREARTTPLLDL